MDARLRRQVREAFEAGDAHQAQAAAHALARAGEADAAAELLPLIARDQPAEAASLQGRLAAPSLDAFHLRVLGTRFAQERLNAVAWAPDGQSLVAIAGRSGTQVLRFVRATGAVDELATLPRWGRCVAVGEQVAVCVKNAGEDGNELALLAGEAPGPTVVASSDWFQVLALEPFPGLLLAATRKVMRAYALDAPGARPTWSVGGEAVAFGLTGAVSYKQGRAAVRLFDLLQRRPRTEVPIAEACPDRHPSFLRQHPEVAAAGQGAVVLYEVARRGQGQVRHAWEVSTDWFATRIGAGGDVVGRVQLPIEGLRAWFADPAGRFLLITQQADADAQTTRSTDAVLVDLVNGDARPLELPALPRCAAWSPSGQTLAVGTDEGTLVLLDASAAARGAPPAPDASTEPAEEGWTELLRGDRFWRIRADGPAVEVHYGIRGAQGTRRRVDCADADAAAAERAKRLTAKRRAGYEG